MHLTMCLKVTPSSFETKDSFDDDDDENMYPTFHEIEAVSPDAILKASIANAFPTAGFAGWLSQVYMLGNHSNIALTFDRGGLKVTGPPGGLVAPHKTKETSHQLLPLTVDGKTSQIPKTRSPPDACAGASLVVRSCEGISLPVIADSKGFARNCHESARAFAFNPNHSATTKSKAFLNSPAMMEVSSRHTTAEISRRSLHEHCNVGCWDDNAGRTRSRAIAIKRSSSHQTHTATDFDHEEILGGSSSERMYDWATWRLYNRIVEYRQKHPVNTSGESMSGAAPESSDEKFGFQPSVYDTMPALGQSRSPGFQRDDGLLEGEVFDLEM